MEHLEIQKDYDPKSGDAFSLLTSNIPHLTSAFYDC
jgi:hypothetical protein